MRKIVSISVPQWLVYSRLWHRQHRQLYLHYPLWCYVQWRHNCVDADAWRRQRPIAWGTIGCFPKWSKWVGSKWLVKSLNTLRPRQNGRHFADDIFNSIFLNEHIWIPIKISLKFVSKGSINNIPALVEIMAWCRPGDKPLSEPMMVNLPTHICVTRPQWLKNERKKLHKSLGFEDRAKGLTKLQDSR